jgi:hypothetical protein
MTIPQEGYTDLANRAVDIAERFSPQVLEAAKSAAVVEAYSFLAAGAAWLFASLVIGGLSYLAYAEGRKDDNEFFGFLAFLGVIISFLCFLPALWSFIDPWTWTTIHHPELWVAKRAFGL